MVNDGCLSYKGFNGHTYYFISAKYEIYTKALSLYCIPPFEQFPAFFIFYMYQQNFSPMLTLYTVV